ncbi:MAG TPA: thioredoxin [bacterium]|nr:thioredoxin [bacterium]
MKSLIRILTIHLVFTFLAVGCAERKTEETGGNPPVPAVQTETAENPAARNPGMEAPRVTLIELGSVNCVPCRMMQPILDEIEKEYAGRVRVVFHDVWTPEGRPYAQQYRIRAIPTQIFLDEEGNEYFRHTGFFPKDDIVAVLKQKGIE